MLLEGLSCEDLGEQVSRVSLARDMFDGDTPGAAKLAHLEELAVDVSRVCSSGIAVAYHVDLAGSRNLTGTFETPFIENR